MEEQRGGLGKRCISHLAELYCMMREKMCLRWPVYDANTLGKITKNSLGIEHFHFIPKCGDIGTGGIKILSGRMLTRRIKNKKKGNI